MKNKEEVMNTDFNQCLGDKRKPYWVWGPLVFSSFFFMPMVFNFQHFTWQTILLSLIIYFAFIFLYKIAVFSQGEQAIIPLSAMIILCIAGTIITPGTQSLFGFAAYFFGFNFTFKKGFAGLITIIASIFLSAYLFDFYDAYFITPAFIISIALFFFGNTERKERIHQQQDDLSQQAIEQLAAVAERERIGRDLHDIIGHSLSSIALKADLAEKLIKAEKNTEAKQEIAAVAQLSRNILSQVRHAVSGLKTRDLYSQLQQLKIELSQQNFIVEIPSKTPSLPDNISSAFTLILMEAVTNILRHSNGNKVAIKIQAQTDAYVLTIFDDGNSKNIKYGNGLTGIKERSQQLHGSFTLSQTQGFTIKVTIPK